MNKIWTIAWKDTYLTFRDRNLLVIMIATPLVLSTLLGVVFGGFVNDDVAFSDIPVVIVNFDEGAAQQGEPINYGDDFVKLLLPGENDGADPVDEITCTLVGLPDEANASRTNVTLNKLIKASVLDDLDAARQGVDNGDYAAAVIIPADFSAQLTLDPASLAGGGGSDPAGSTAIEVYANSGQPISSMIVRSIVEGYTNTIVTGNIAISTSINALVSTNPMAAIGLGSEAAQGIYPCAFSGLLDTVKINQLPVVSEGGVSLSGIAQILVVFGSAQAAFFALFTGQFGIISVVEERRQGTLQRLVISPTPRSAILAGKLLGTFITVVFQLLVLLLALTIVASIMDGKAQFIWGSNLIGVTAVVASIALAVCGLGVLMAGLARTPEQVGAYGSVINIIIGIAGGGFGFVVPSPFREMSIIYWGSHALDKLAHGHLDYGVNVLVLVAMGAVLFVIGSWLFSRRLDI